MVDNKLSSEYILSTSRDYSIYVCENRAIPKVSDGLKTGQRYVLWLLRNKQKEIKTVSLGGEMISSGLYLHGDASANGTISLLAAPYTNNIPYIEGIGTFGTRVAPVEGIGAPRYTYVVKSNVTEKLIYPDLSIVPVKDNYDGSTKEPDTFLPILPVILLNGISGIAVGWSTVVLPRNIRDIINSTVAAIDGKKIKKLIPSYSFLDVDVEHLGGNSWVFIGKVELIDKSKLKIKELPPDLTLDKFKNRLVQMEEDGKIRDFIDRSTNKIDIEIKFKRGTIGDWTEDDAIKFFKLQTKKTERIVVIDWSGDAIRQYETAEELVKDFVDWRFGYYVLRYQKLYDDTSYSLKYWQGVKECFDKDLPSMLTNIKDKKSVEDKIEKITLKFKLDEKLIDRIVNFPTYRWSKESYLQCKEKIKELRAAKKEYNILLKDHNKIWKIFREEVVNLRNEKFVR